MDPRNRLSVWSPRRRTHKTRAPQTAEKNPPEVAHAYGVLIVKLQVKVISLSTSSYTMIRCSSSEELQSEETAWKEETHK